MSADSSLDLEPAAGPTRALIYTPTGRDARLTAELLSKGGFTCTVCATVDDLCTGIEEGAGIVLIAAEGLSPGGMTMLAGTLRAQPPWSDIPLMIFVAQPEMERAARSFEQLGGSQVILLDRPIRVGTLLSTARSALSGRIKQYEIRDLLEDQQRRLEERQLLLENERASARRLAGLAEASIAIASALSLDEVLKMITDQARRLINASVALTAIRITEALRDRTVQAVSSSDDFDTSSLGWNDGPPESAQASALELESMIRLDHEGLERHPIRRLFDPSSIHAVIAAPLLEREGKRVGVIALACRDSQFSSEDESVLTQLAQTASAAIQNARLYREAQEANRVKDDFLATLAHELRTPMTGILGWIQMLKLDKSDPDDVDRAIAMIESSTTVQARLVEDLLDVSRIISGKLRIDFSAVELAPIAENVVDTFKARAEEAGVKLVSSIDPLPISVFGDEMRLHQVMWNLLSNAIKFTPKGGRVSVSLTRAGSEAVLEVSDTGRGIAPEFLPYVFERYTQADSTTTRQQAGLGLGLAIVRHLVELHGGRVEVSSDGIDRGTTFTVKPLRPR